MFRVLIITGKGLSFQSLSICFMLLHLRIMKTGIFELEQVLKKYIFKCLIEEVGDSA